jgi:hypothetical protein
VLIVSGQNQNVDSLAVQEADFRRNGYVVIPDAVKPETLTLLQQATENHSSDPRFQASGGRNLLGIDPVFEAMIDGHAAMPLLERLIPDLQLLSMDLRSCPPGGGAMMWHADIPFFSDQAIVSVNTALYLDDLTPQNGALRVLPRSHRTPYDLPPEMHNSVLPGEVLVEVPAGTMVVFQDTLWHRTGDNTTDRQRRGVFTYYGHYWMKQCHFPGESRPFSAMTEFIQGKGERRARLMGAWMEGSEFNSFEAIASRSAAP